VADTLPGNLLPKKTAMKTLTYLFTFLLLAATAAAPPPMPTAATNWRCSPATKYWYSVTPASKRRKPA
jgi:hypothetical protein